MIDSRSTTLYLLEKHRIWTELFHDALKFQIPVKEHFGSVRASDGVRAQVEQVADPALPVAEIVRRCPARQLMALYRVPAFAGPDEFLRHVAAARGKLRKGGTADSGVRAGASRGLGTTTASYPTRFCPVGRRQSVGCCGCPEWMYT